MNEDSQASKHEQLAMITAFMDAPLVAPGSGKISSNIVTVVERLLKKHMQKNTKIHTHTYILKLEMELT